jgi:hypothetical protein
MSKTYAIADLHGRLDLLEMALAQIASHAELSATLVTLGDYVDRGPDCRKVIGRLMGGLGHGGWRLMPQRQPRGHHVADLPPKSAGLWLVARQWWRRDADLLRAK